MLATLEARVREIADAEPGVPLRLPMLVKPNARLATRAEASASHCPFDLRLIAERRYEHDVGILREQGNAECDVVGVQIDRLSSHEDNPIQVTAQSLERIQQGPAGLN